MLHVSSFSSHTFLHTRIPNMDPWILSMVHNISIDCSCSLNKLLRKDFYPMKVNQCQNFTLTVLAVTFSYTLYFAFEITNWIDISNLFYLRYRDTIFVGFYWLKMSFQISKSPRNLMTSKNMKKNSYKTSCFTVVTTF
jgi:hypothetical protein